MEFAALTPEQGGLMLLAFLFVLIAWAYIALSPRMAPALYRSSLFRPLIMDGDVVPPTVGDVQGEDVEIVQAQNIKLHGWLFQLPNAKYTFLISHGNGGNISTKLPLVEALLSLGGSVFTYDYSGYGKSTGLPNLRNVCENAHCAYDYLVNVKNIKPEQIILYGESLGAAISAELATARKARALIIQSAFFSLRKIALETKPILTIYPPFLFPKPHLNTGSILSQLKMPVLIMHGTKDSVVPHHHAESLFKLAASPKKLALLTDAAHSDLLAQQPTVFYEEIRLFLKGLEQ